MEEDVLVLKSSKDSLRTKKKKIKRIIGLFLFSILIVSLGINFTVGCRRSYFALNKNSAKWVNAQGQKYLFIEAENEFELGKLEGKYLSAKITNLKRIIQLFGLLNGKHGFSYLEMIKMAQEYEKHIDLQYLEEMRGIDTAIVGVSYKDILLQNCFIDILYGNYFSDPELNPDVSSLQMGCTVVGYKNNGSVFVGQNFDFNNVFKHSLAFVHHKIQGKHAQFTLKVGGILSIPCGLNSAGTSVFVNVVRTNVRASYCTPISIRCREAFDTAINPNEFKDILTDDSSSLSMNLLIANATQMISIEAVPGNFSITSPDQCVNTNTYTDEFFQQFLQDKSYSKLRQNITEDLLWNNTLDNSLSQPEFISILNNPMIFQAESGLMGVSSLICLSNEFYCKGVPSSTEVYPLIPSFF